MLLLLASESDLFEETRIATATGIPSNLLTLLRRQRETENSFSYHTMIPRYTVCSLQNEYTERIAKIVFLASLPDIHTRNKLKKCILLVTGDFAWMYNPNRTYVKKSAWYCSILEYRVLHEAYLPYCNLMKILDEQIN